MYDKMPIYVQSIFSFVSHGEMRYVFLLYSYRDSSENPCFFIHIMSRRFGRSAPAITGCPALKKKVYDFDKVMKPHFESS